MPLSLHFLVPRREKDLLFLGFVETNVTSHSFYFTPLALHKDRALSCLGPVQLRSYFLFFMAASSPLHRLVASSDVVAHPPCSRRVLCLPIIRLCQSVESASSSTTGKCVYSLVYARSRIFKCLSRQIAERHLFRGVPTVIAC